MQPTAAGMKCKSASRGNHAEIPGRQVNLMYDKKNDPSKAMESLHVTGPKEEPESWKLEVCLVSHRCWNSECRKVNTYISIHQSK